MSRIKQIARCVSISVLLLYTSMVLADTEQPAPYSIKIITHGEGAPRSDNATKKGKQDNRRVDVTLSKKSVTDVIDDRSIQLDQGGTIWITKDPSSIDRLLEITSDATVVLENAEPKNPIKFKLKTNYASFIDKWEIVVYPTGSAPGVRDLHVIRGEELGLTNQIQWDGAASINNSELALRHGLEVEYLLRVYDGSGHYDQTHPKVLRFVNDTSQDKGRRLATAAISELSIDEQRDYAELATSGIRLTGAKVRLHGLDLLPGQKISINGDSVTLDDQASFVVEYLLPGGKHTFDITVSDKNSEPRTRSLQVDLDTEYFFMIALADITVGENKVSGSIEPLAVDKHHYGGDIFVDGRLAFYLKGKIKGKYLLTAQLDTGTEDVSEVFDDLHEKDPDSVFRRLDPDQYYPVYGDDSTIYDDTHSQGKIYLRFEWDKSHLLWGNYNTSFTGTELAPFNRSLYGAQALHRSTSNTALGDTKTDLSAFISEAQSAHRHNEFLGTGGSLYYLKDTDIVRGSEKVWVEVRQSGSTRIVQKIELIEGRDYEIDDFQGRLILKRPLLSVSTGVGPSIIKDEPLDGNETYLVVDYEYVPDDFSSDQVTAGVRSKRWLTDHIGVGGTWANEQRDGDDYDLKGVDLTLKKSTNTYIKGELARSESSQSAGSFVSTDGGLTFETFNSNAGETLTGSATSLEARVDLRDLRATTKDVSVGAWLKTQESGFSTTSRDTGVDTVDSGIEAIAIVSDKVTLSGRALSLDRQDESRTTSVAVQADYAYNDALTLSGEVRQVNEHNKISDTKGEGTLGAAKVGWDISEALNVYSIAQATLAKSGTYDDNDLLTIGSVLATSESIKLHGELSTGNRGESVEFGMDWRMSDTYSVYSNMRGSLDKQSQNRNALTVGQRKGVSSQLKVYTEHQFSQEDSQSGLAQTVGADYSFTKNLSGNVSYQTATLEDDEAESINRDALSAGLNYRKNKSRLSSKIEYRRDTGANLNTRQWVSTNRFEYRPSASLRWQGKLNGSVTTDKLSALEDAKFVEAGIGFAYRPVTHDRLNMLGRLTYLYDLSPFEQSGDPAQRSIIASLESVYQLTHFWSLGSKVARRESEIKLDRDDDDWIGNDASLLGVRVQLRVPFGLEASLSHHWLFSEASDSTRHGSLISLGKGVSDHLKLSVGYNFSSFDDDLGNDSYEYRGWFVNLVGTY